MENEAEKNQAYDVQPSVIFCRRCGTKIPGDSIYCTKCGVKVCSVAQEVKSYGIDPCAPNLTAADVAQYAFENSLSIETAYVAINHYRKIAGMSLMQKPQKEGYTQRGAHINHRSDVEPWSGASQRKQRRFGGQFFRQDGVILSSFLIFAAVVLFFCLIYSAYHPAETYPAEASVPTLNATAAPMETEKKREPEDVPINGKILIGTRFNGVNDSKITIHASSKNCVVKLKTENGNTVLSFFVRANETVTLGVPGKKLYAYFAEGDDWYGMYDNFGEFTAYSKDPNPVDFSRYTITYTLYEVTNGNLVLDQIDADDF